MKKCELFFTCLLLLFIAFLVDDHSRVVLSLQDSTPGSDYINASFVDVRHLKLHMFLTFTHISSVCCRLTSDPTGTLPPRVPFLPLSQTSGG